MKVTLKTKRNTAQIHVSPDENILFAGLRQGWALPHACASGTCGTCQARLIDGEIANLWEDAPGQNQFVEGSERILLCQASSRSVSTLQLFGRLEIQTDEFPRPDYANGTLLEFTQISSEVAYFEVALDRDFPFIAGQFAMLRFPTIKGWRAYSMCTKAENTQKIKFLIKRLPNGTLSKYLFETKEIGQKIEVFGPLGRACLLHTPEEKNITAIAGGSGIAGLLAVMEEIIDKRHFIINRVQLFFGLRAPSDDFVLDRLSDLVEHTSGQIEVTIVYSETTGEANYHPEYTNLKIGYGYVHDWAFAAMQKKEIWEGQTYFVAGPPKMVTATETALQTRFGVAPEKIRLDRFG